MPSLLATRVRDALFLRALNSLIKRAQGHAGIHPRIDFAADSQIESSVRCPVPGNRGGSQSSNS